jgi:hypothetical protein
MTGYSINNQILGLGSYSGGTTGYATNKSCIDSIEFGSATSIIQID